jgi:hypothetical protein
MAWGGVAAAAVGGCGLAAFADDRSSDGFAAAANSVVTADSSVSRLDLAIRDGVSPLFRRGVHHLARGGNDDDNVDVDDDAVVVAVVVVAVALIFLEGVVVVVAAAPEDTRNSAAIGLLRLRAGDEPVVLVVVTLASLREATLLSLFRPSLVDSIARARGGC